MTATRAPSGSSIQAAIAAVRQAAAAPGGTVATMTRTAPAVAPSGPVAPRSAISGEVAGQRQQQIDGAEILGWTRAFLKRYAVFPSESALNAVTLWVAASHARDESGVLVFGEFPRLGLLSSEPGSGKSRVLELLQLLCPSAPSIEGEPSEAAVALMIGKEHRTLLIDEGDILFGSGRRKSAIRAVINQGYKRGGTWSRVRSGKVESVPVFGALALAGLDVMEKGTGSALEALLQRFIIIRMRKATGCQIRKPREIVDPARGITGYEFAARLRDLLSAWAAQERGALAALMPQLPPGVELRQEELWAPLLAVAERAGVSALAAKDGTEDGDDPGLWQRMAWDACTDISLYGGTPDVIGESLDMLGGIAEGWE